MTTMTMHRSNLKAILLCLLLPSIAAQDPDTSFFFACSGGKVDEVAAALEAHPEWAEATTADGETCLHLAAIPGSAEITKLLLEKGGDPNVRSTFEGGLRMHPLSWNTYGGHHESIKLLLKHGAEVNADFDLQEGQEKVPVTALDIAMKLSEQNGNAENPNLEPFRIARDLLLENGGKAYVELQKEKEL